MAGFAKEPMWHECRAEATSLPDRSFDLAFSEYGAAIWCDPYAWIPEAHRLLRPGGRLIFLCNSVLMMLCSPPSEEPAGETIVRPQFGLYRIDWPDAEGPTFDLPHGEMLRLLRETGFEVEALHELRAPEGPEDEVRFYLRRGWARRWPGEEVWVARRSPAWSNRRLATCLAGCHGQPCASAINLPPTRAGTDGTKRGDGS